MEEALGTTNVLLGIMAAVSVLEAIALVVAGIFGYRAYRQVMDTVQGLEQRQVAPLVARAQDTLTRVDRVLDDVKGVTETVHAETRRVDEALRETMVRVDETAQRVRDRVRWRMNTVVGTIRALRSAIESALTSDGAGRREPGREPAEPASAHAGSSVSDPFVPGGVAGPQPVEEAKR